MLLSHHEKRPDGKLPLIPFNISSAPFMFVCKSTKCCISLFSWQAAISPSLMFSPSICSLLVYVLSLSLCRTLGCQAAIETSSERKELSPSHSQRSHVEPYAVNNIKRWRRLRRWVEMMQDTGHTQEEEAQPGGGGPARRRRPTQEEEAHPGGGGPELTIRDPLSTRAEKHQHLNVHKKHSEPQQLPSWLRKQGPPNGREQI